MRIMLIDDNAHALKLAKAVLASAGLGECREYTDARDALRNLPTFRPDLILVDFEMRPMDGLEFTRSVRGAGARWAGMPILMMTGHTSREHVLAARKAGVSGFLVKPFSTEGLLSHVRKALNAKAEAPAALSQQTQLL